MVGQTWEWPHLELELLHKPLGDDIHLVGLDLELLHRLGDNFSDLVHEPRQVHRQQMNFSGLLNAHFSEGIEVLPRDF